VSNGKRRTGKGDDWGAKGKTFVRRRQASGRRFSGRVPGPFLEGGEGKKGKIRRGTDLTDSRGGTAKKETMNGEEEE